MKLPIRKIYALLLTLLMFVAVSGQLVYSLGQKPLSITLNDRVIVKELNKDNNIAGAVQSPFSPTEEKEEEGHISSGNFSKEIAHSNGDDPLHFLSLMPSVRSHGAHYEGHDAYRRTHIHDILTPPPDQV